MTRHVAAEPDRPGASAPRGAVQAAFEDLGTPLFDVTFAVLDLETTGLSAERDRITEVGVVKVRRGDVLGEFQCLVAPGVPVPPAVSRLTGITDHLLSDRPPIEAVLPMLLEFLRGTTVVAHNAHFDVAFLRAALRRHGYPPLANPVVDTARLARRVLRPDGLRDVRLETLAHHLRARTKPEHRALADARATVDVFHGLLERVGNLGVRTLEELRDYSRSTSDPAYRKVGLVAGAPDAPGVYRFLDDRGRVLYVGKALRLRERLRQYFGQDRRRKVADLVRATAAVTWQVTPTALEAEVLELREIRAHQPRFNRRSRGPRPAVYVKLTRERFPRLSIVSAPRDQRAVHVGPFAGRKAAERFVDAVTDAIPLRRCTDRLSRPGQRAPCILKDLGRCGAPCDGSQDEDAYGQVVQRYLEAVTADPTALLDGLRRVMASHAATERFEGARRLRGRLHHTAAVLREARRIAQLVEVEELVATRRDGDAWEVAVVQRGRLVGTARVPTAEVADAAAALRRAAPAPPPPGLPPPEDVEELRLVASWLDRPGIRLVHVAGTYAEPVAGGATLHAHAAEARRVARAVRRDRQLLGGEEVLRRP